VADKSCYGGIQQLPCFSDLEGRENDAAEAAAAMDN
jgi:hypothetical protein